MDPSHLNRTLFQFIILTGDNTVPMLHDETEGDFAFLEVTCLSMGSNPLINQADLTSLVAVIADQLLRDVIHIMNKRICLRGYVISKNEDANKTNHSNYSLLREILTVGDLKVGVKKKKSQSGEIYIYLSNIYIYSPIL